MYVAWLMFISERCIFGQWHFLSLIAERVKPSLQRPVPAMFAVHCGVCGSDYVVSLRYCLRKQILICLLYYAELINIP